MCHVKYYILLVTSTRVIAVGNSVKNHIIVTMAISKLPVASKYLSGDLGR